MFEAFIAKTKLMELLMLCQVFFQKHQGKEKNLWAKNAQIFCQLY